MAFHANAAEANGDKVILWKFMEEPHAALCEHYGLKERELACIKVFDAGIDLCQVNVVILAKGGLIEFGPVDQSEAA